MEIEPGYQAKATRTQNQFPADIQTKMALVIEPAAGAHGGDAKETETGVEIDAPGSCPFVSDLYLESGIEFEHFQELHFTVQCQQEASTVHGNAGQGACDVGGIQLQLAGGIDLDDLIDVGLYAYIQYQGNTRVRIVVHRGAALGLYRDRTE